MASALAVLLAGCSELGPSSIYSGRTAYNEAIGKTGDQQILDQIVRNRFGESVGLLAVSSINANFSVSGSLGANLGFGDAANYAGNLVPLSAGAAYEESPTITYTPVAGKDYLAELYGHLPLDDAILLIEGGAGAEQATIMLLKSINGLRNPAYITDSALKANARFLRVAELFGELRKAELLAFAADGNEAFAYFVPDPDPRYTAASSELMQLLSLPRTSERSHRIPIRLGTGTPDELEILVTTRSIADLVQIASASMDVPQAQVEAGIALPTPPLGAIGDLIEIRSSKSVPDDALVATQAHGTWYFIAQEDARSKVYFRLLERLADTRIADAARRHATTPLLTVPVAR